MIRLATIDDLPQIVDMGLHFLEASAYGHQIARNPEQLRQTAEALIMKPVGDIFVVDDGYGLLTGMIAVAVYPHLLSGERVASELCWWVEPAARGTLSAARLLRYAEAWAIAQDADVFQMMAPTEDVGRIYEKRHYEKLETHYQRRLKHGETSVSRVA